MNPDDYEELDEMDPPPLTSNQDTYPTPEHGWTCFHCGETFTHPTPARLHFGASIHDEPKCQISAHRLRAMEAQLLRYREEDTDLHRQIARMQADHAVALRRAEEKGYASGLWDADDAVDHYESCIGGCEDWDHKVLERYLQKKGYIR